MADDMMDDGEGAVSRWLPAAVVSVALIGFVALAWYAYRSGTQSLDESDLLVVEADTSPMKEKPLDPGGMKFPNQDKTVFDTFAGAQQMPPKVERVLPAPEEPMVGTIDTSGTKTWINDKLRAPVAEVQPATEQIIGEVKPSPAAPAVKVSAPVKEEKPAAGIIKEAAAAPAVVKKEVKKVEAPKPPAPKAVAPKNPAGTAKVQLGAYASEDEAKHAWEKIRKKISELADKTVYVVKADLGAKGIYYRLRAGNVGDLSDAKALCGRLSAKGQACMAIP